MDWQPIITFISSVGFPIAMCVLMAWYINKKDEKDRDVVQKQTECITALCEKIDTLIDFVRKS